MPPLCTLFPGHVSGLGMRLIIIALSLHNLRYSREILKEQIRNSGLISSSAVSLTLAPQEPGHEASLIHYVSTSLLPPPHPPPPSPPPSSLLPPDTLCLNLPPPHPPSSSSSLLLLLPPPHPPCQRAGIYQLDQVNRLPTLVNLNEDPQLSEMLLYVIKEGRPVCMCVVAACVSLLL